MPWSRVRRHLDLLRTPLLGLNAVQGRCGGQGGRGRRIHETFWGPARAARGQGTKATARRADGALSLGDLATGV